MDSSTLQTKLYAGYAAAAKRIGQAFTQYRPAAGTAALAAGNVIGTVLAAFDAGTFNFAKGQDYGKASWECLADGRVLQPGDYLSGNSGTYFIAAMQPLVPIQAVQCNCTVTLWRPQQQPGVGALGYGGSTKSNETEVATSFPASVLAATKTGHAPNNLPGDVAAAWYTLLLPALPGGAQLLAHDVLTNDLGYRYVLLSVELSTLGWRCSMMQAET
ncbi:hypothetical protein EO087_00220 [Dyella sp. M7H15-1]|uniref:hypothetical protein n=1 Tax=Dyella sp. M7H15-1 TaxID=2501295 RepID=UPI0010050361|nr:hypothetical protein [Dyella sp. M7H15-1]QAU22590.1 hypothetical protein EO087_00220 [Dyella sp. M7H15-1]